MTKEPLLSASERWKKIITRCFNSKWTHGLATLTVVIYILGFVVVHNYLSGHGIHDLEIGSAYYLSGGIIFFVYLVVFCTFSGSSVVEEQLESGTYSDIVKQVGVRRALVVISIRLIFISTDFVFYTCIGASIFSVVAFTLPISGVFWVCLVGFWFVKFSFVVKTARLYSKTSVVTGKLIKIPLIFSFFYTMENWQFHAVFFSYIFLSLLIFLLIDRKNISRRGVRTGVYAVMLSLVYAFIFGQLFYGEIPRKYGGGQPLYADIQFEEDILPFSNRGHSAIMTGVKIIHITDKHVYIEENGEIIRLPDSSILGMKIKSNANKEN